MAAAITMVNEAAIGNAPGELSALNPAIFQDCQNSPMARTSMISPKISSPGLLARGV